MGNDDPREPDDDGDKGTPIGVVIGVIVTVLLIGALVVYVGAVTSPPPTGTGVANACLTACTLWVKIDCPGGKVLDVCSWDHPLVTCGPPVHTCGVNPPYPP